MNRQTKEVIELLLSRLLASLLYFSFIFLVAYMRLYKSLSQFVHPLIGHAAEIFAKSYLNRITAPAHPY